MSDAEFIAGLQHKYDMLEADVENLYRLIMSERNGMGLAGVPFENETVQSIWNEVKPFIKAASVTESVLNSWGIDHMENTLTGAEEYYPRLRLKEGVLRKDRHYPSMFPEEESLKKDSGEGV